MLRSDLLAEYCRNFFGFGSWNAPVWFIGLEEGGGWEESEIKVRLDAWEAFGKRTLEDAPRFYPASKTYQWHGPSSKLQPTWGQLIRMLFLLQGRSDSEQDLLQFQREKLGALDDKTCLVELLPLPSPKTSIWKYAAWSNLDWLQSRKSYGDYFLTNRINFLKDKIRQNKPKMVIFYGTSQLASWSKIAGSSFEKACENKLLRFTSTNTMFFVTQHPVLHMPEHFRSIGLFLRSHYQM